MTRKPAVTFAIVCVIAVVGLVAYLFHTGSRLRDARETAPPGPPPNTAIPDPGSATAPAPTPSEAPAPTAAAAAPVSPNAAPAPSVPATASARLFFRHNGVEAHYGSVAWVDTAKLDDVHYVDSLRCEVVHVSGGHGICLSADRGVFTTYAATLFDAKSFAARKPFSLKGIPSRARVSVDGRLAALTVFVSGHGYTSLDFSTQTLIVEYATGAVLADLEDFGVTQDGAPIKKPDFNFWGVTFTPDARNFYATLSTAGKHYLIRGDIAARSATSHPRKRRVPFAVAGCAARGLQEETHGRQSSAVATARAGTRDWRAKRRCPKSAASTTSSSGWTTRHVLYSVPSKDDGSSPSTDVWRVAVDARTPPELFLRNAYSPATARGSPR